MSARAAVLPDAIPFRKHVIGRYHRRQCSSGGGSSSGRCRGCGDGGAGSVVGVGVGVVVVNIVGEAERLNANARHKNQLHPNALRLATLKCQ